MLGNHYVPCYPPVWWMGKYTSLADQPCITETMNEESDSPFLSRYIGMVLSWLDKYSLSHSACDGEAPTSLWWAHSCHTAHTGGPSDADLACLETER